MEGFDVVLGVDNWKGCMETYMHNHPKTDFLLMDINELDPDTLPKADVILGSPPCTNFSHANLKRNLQEGFELVDRFLTIIEHCDPEYWIMENISTSHELIQHLNGYPKMIIRCSDFGVNTIRRRLFAGQFPQPFSMGTIDRKKAYPSILTKDPYTQMKKTNWNGRGIEQEDFTPEFMADVQAFPKSFKFIGSKTTKEKMIGNAVPPEMSRILARAIKEDYD
jgi:site-specific DNA-cytosine methylase